MPADYGRRAKRHCRIDNVLELLLNPAGSAARARMLIPVPEQRQADMRNGALLRLFFHD
jgi:hypothetical protein